LKALPAEATTCLVLNVQWFDLYHRALAIGDALFGGPSDEPLEKTLDGLAGGLGVDLHKDLLDRLEPLVLIHDYPQHPLGLPLMVTLLAAVEPGSQARAVAALSRLTSAAGAALDGGAAADSRSRPQYHVEPERSSPTPSESPSAGAHAMEDSLGAMGRAMGVASDFTRLRIRTDSDGTSYLQLGIVGPAWAWIDNRLVISWSPGAVRANSAAAVRVPSSAFAWPPAAP
jgi:hypothetical protein